jgi:hypothetical protein
MSNYHIWLRKIKEDDPNNIPDSGFYFSPYKKEIKEY